MAQVAWAVFLALLLTTMLQTIVSPAPTRLRVTTSCDSAAQLREIARSAATSLSNALTTALTQTQEASRLQVIAATRSGYHGAGAAILAQAKQREAQKIMKALANGASDILSGIMAAGSLAGNQETLQELESTKIKDAALKTASAAVTDGTGTKITPELTTQTHGVCMKNEETRADTTIADTAAPPQPTVILYTTTAATPGTNAGEDLTLCGSGSTSGTVTGRSSCTSGTATGIGIKGGKLFKNQQVEAKLQTTGTAKAYSEVGSTTTIPSAKTIKRELAEILKMQNAETALQAATTETPITTLATEHELKELISKAIDGDDATYSDSKTTPKVDAFLKSAFGKNNEAVKNTIIKELNDLKPAKAAVG
uniref:Variant surface glycoprotein 1550 n=1 Tax=Trypanosoma brucei TaxID=5691 RepID=M4SWN6_9TRYP|nr:variant surface glycoprotein 1550 [Trypanosoma brucei]